MVSSPAPSRDPSASWSLGSLRERLAQLLIASGLLPEGWGLRSLERLEPDGVLLDLGPAEGRGVLLEWREHGGQSVPAFLRGPRYAVGYRDRPGAWSLDDGETPAEVKRASALVCQHLARAVEDLPLSSPPPRPLEEREGLPFDARGLHTRLAPVLGETTELVEGWRLDDAYDFGPEEVALGFVHPELEDSARLKVRPRDDDRPAAYRTEQLDVLYRIPFGRPRSEDHARAHDHLARELSLLLEEAERDVRFERIERAPADMPAPRQGPPPAINMAIPAPCHLECNFCSIKEEIDPIVDPSDEFVEHLRQDLRRAAAEGTKTVRVNGLEPLNAPYVWDLLALARDVGFEEVHVLSTFLPLDDPANADRLFEVLPDRYRLYVPLYGSCSEVHDKVVGREGAFAELLRAIGHANEHMAADEAAGSERQGMIIITTILTSDNVHDARAMADLVGPLCRWWEVHLPFPNTSSRRDRYPEVTITMSEALEAIYPRDWSALTDLPLGEVLPCIALDHQQRSGHRLISEERLRRRRPEPSGTYYETIGFTHSLGGGEAVAFTAATVPCPHSEGCALAGVCPRKVYGAYARAHGIEELQPVSEAEILALSDGEAVLAVVAESEALRG